MTGGSGFIGKALVRALSDAGHTVRVLVRPSPRSPDLPRGLPVEAAVASLSDPRGLRAAMLGVDTVYHLAGVERRGAYANLMAVDIQGTRAVAQAAADAGVGRFFYLSHLGADRASAFPVLKAKAIAEEFIRRSGVDYTILRSGVIFGPNDGFTTGLARLLALSPFAFFIPGDGRTLIQPLWIEDLVACLVWALDDDKTRNETFEIGGMEYFPFLQIVEMVMQATGNRRRVVHIPYPYLRGVTVLLETIFPRLPISVYWLDYLAANRTCALDSVPRIFNLMPARFAQRLDHLRPTA
ncbi:MAG: NAD(P)H-binding protein [Chloroflexi bacterium]|nr:NAD(P)H-binding protein [Chloroflexota bacterium]